MFNIEGHEEAPLNSWTYSGLHVWLQSVINNCTIILHSPSPTFIKTPSLQRQAEKLHIITFEFNLLKYFCANIGNSLLVFRDMEVVRAVYKHNIFGKKTKNTILSLSLAHQIALHAAVIHPFQSNTRYQLAFFGECKRRWYLKALHTEEPVNWKLQWYFVASHWDQWIV